MIVAGCRFSKDLVGFGGATTSNPALLSVGDLWIRGDPSALVKKIQKIGKAPQAQINTNNDRIVYSDVSNVSTAQSKHT